MPQLIFDSTLPDFLQKDLRSLHADTQAFDIQEQSSLSGFTALVLSAETFNQILIDSALIINSIIVWNPRQMELAENNSHLVLFEMFSPPQKNQLRSLLLAQRRILVTAAAISRQTKNLNNERLIKQELLDIGVSLSASRNNEVLINLILHKIRELTNSDAGSLYLVGQNPDSGEEHLIFKLVQNDSIITDFTEFQMAINTESLAGHVAITKKPLTISDVYHIPSDLNIKFNRAFDKANGYRTKSIMTVPMLDHNDQVIGVIQLVNKKSSFKKVLKNETATLKYVEDFTAEDESVILSLASQIAIMLENNRLYEEIAILFDSFVRAATKAIEVRDPTTSGHSYRVTELSDALAKAVNYEKSGPCADLKFNQTELKELNYACLLHDFGKVGVREAVLGKQKKIFENEMITIKCRFDHIKACVCFHDQSKRRQYIEKNGPREYRQVEETFDRELSEQLAGLDDDWRFIQQTNEPTILPTTALPKLDEMKNRSYPGVNGEKLKLLTKEEYENLKIEKGSLNEQERREIQSHASHSYDFLNQIPWTKEMSNIPAIGRSHHEVLDGSGYPNALAKDQIPIQSQIMAIADIFEALTCRDRPYKKAVPLDRALRIIKSEAENGKLNRDLVDIFISKKVYKVIEEKTE